MKVFVLALMLPVLTGCHCIGHGPRPEQAAPARAQPEAAAAPAPVAARNKPRASKVRRLGSLRLSIDVQGVPLEDVMDQIGRQVGWNILVDPKVQETVTVRLVDVRWRDAVDIIARMTRCQVVEIRPGGLRRSF